MISLELTMACFRPSMFHCLQISRSLHLSCWLSTLYCHSNEEYKSCYKRNKIFHFRSYTKITFSQNHFYWRRKLVRRFTHVLGRGFECCRMLYVTFTMSTTRVLISKMCLMPSLCSLSFPFCINITLGICFHSNQLFAWHVFVET